MSKEKIEDVKQDVHGGQPDVPEVTVLVKQPPKEKISKPKREMTEKQKAAFEKMRSGLQRWREERPDYSSRMRALVEAEKRTIEQRIKSEASLPPNAKVVVKSRRGRQPGTKFPNQGRQVYTPAQSELESEAEPPTKYSESSSIPETDDTDTDTDQHDRRRVDRKKRQQKKKPAGHVVSRQAVDQVLPQLVRTQDFNPMRSYLDRLNGGWF